MEKRWEEVYNFLSLGTYPSGYSKSQKLNLRRYASKFKVKEGELFFGSRSAVKSKENARKLFKEFHSSPTGGHSGILKTRTAMCSKFYWLGINVENVIGIDVMGPLPKTVEGFQYILTATDYFSKWVEAFPLKTKSATEVGRHICSIIYRHGCPKRIITDQGREFVNEVLDFLHQPLVYTWLLTLSTFSIWVFLWAESIQLLILLQVTITVTVFLFSFPTYFFLMRQLAVHFWTKKRNQWKPGIKQQQKTSPSLRRNKSRPMKKEYRSPKIVVNLSSVITPSCVCLTQ
uniref:Integrase catalytic domain-containing protein n=1 Tax=Mastacembelus armatus TaxID=205130 RepID=A0A3Q3LEK6_9TELE